MPRIQKVRPRSRAQIERAAHDLLRKFHPDTLKQVMPFDVVRFFEFDMEDDIGVEPVFEVLDEDVEGYTDCLNQVCKISISLYDHGDNDVKRRRLRATVAHEIGHVYLHFRDAQKRRTYDQIFTNNGGHPLELYDPDDVKAFENPEWQAWAFASALLMPEQCFLAAVNNNRTRRQMKNGFDVNPSFVDVRLRELKVSKIIRNG